MILRDLRRRGQKYAVQSVVICLVLYFLFHLVQGGRGIVTLKSLEKKLQESTQRLDALKGSHDKLAHKVDLMKPGAVCPDLLEEQAKQILGYSHPEECVVLADPLPREEPGSDSPGE